MTGDTSTFSLVVQTEFAFLESRFGFRLNSQKPSPTSVRYETATHYVLIALDPRMDVQMQFGRRGLDDAIGAYSFETGDLMQPEHFNGWREDTSPSGTAGWVTQLARLLEKRIEAGLFENPSTLEMMKSRRDSEIAAWHRDERERPIRLKAAAAWQDKDYKAVVDALAGIEQSLTEGETHRLRYARKQL